MAAYTRHSSGAVKQGGVTDLTILPPIPEGLCFPLAGHSSASPVAKSAWCPGSAHKCRAGRSLAPLEVSIAPQSSLRNTSPPIELARAAPDWCSASVEFVADWSRSQAEGLAPQRFACCALPHSKCRL